MIRLLIIALLTLFTLGTQAQPKPVPFPTSSGTITGWDAQAKVLNIQARPKEADTRSVWFHLGVKGLPLGSCTIRLHYERETYAPLLLAYRWQGQAWARAQANKAPGFYDYVIDNAGADSLWVATGYPYDLSRLKSWITELQTNSSQQLGKGTVLRLDTLCTSTGGIQVPLLRVGNKAGGRTIFISGRQHAFESPTSYALEGFVNFLLGKDPLAQQVRNKYQLLIVPMVDVDKVQQGGTGKDQKPIDFNRSWGPSSPWTQIMAIKKLLYTQDQLAPLVAAIDFHSPFPQDAKGCHYYNTFEKGSAPYLMVDSLFSRYVQLEGTSKLPATRSNNPPPAPGEAVIRSFLQPHKGPGGPAFQRFAFATTYEQAWDQRKDGVIFTQEQLEKSGENLGRAFAETLLRVK